MKFFKKTTVSNRGALKSSHVCISEGFPLHTQALENELGPEKLGTSSVFVFPKNIYFL